MEKRQHDLSARRRSWTDRVVDLKCVPNARDPRGERLLPEIDKNAIGSVVVAVDPIDIRVTVQIDQQCRVRRPRLDGCPRGSHIAELSFAIVEIHAVLTTVAGDEVRIPIPVEIAQRDTLCPVGIARKAGLRAICESPITVVQVEAILRAIVAQDAVQISVPVHVAKDHCSRLVGEVREGTEDREVGLSVIVAQVIQSVVCHDEIEIPVAVQVPAGSSVGVVQQRVQMSPRVTELAPPVIQIEPIPPALPDQTAIPKKRSRSPSPSKSARTTARVSSSIAGSADAVASLKIPLPSFT